MDNFTWEEVSPGTFERAPSPFEKGLAQIGNLYKPTHEEKCVYASASFNYSPQNSFKCEDAGRMAWIQMRYQYPSIASTLKAAGEKLQYCSPATETAVNDWLSNTFIVTSSDVKSIIRQAKPKDYATLFLNPERREVLLQTSHWRIDGTGCLLFFNAFFDALGDPQRATFGDEYLRLSPPIESLVDFAAASSSQANAEIDTMVDEFLDAQPSIGLSIGVDDEWLGSDAVRVTMSTEETAALVAKLKAKGVTVAKAFQAAMYLAIADCQGPQQNSGRIANMTIVNVRSWCGKSGVEVPIAPLFYPTLTVVDPNTDFGDIVSQIDKHWKKWVRTDLYKSGYTHAMDRLLPMVSQPPPIPPSTPFLTSTGIAEQYLRREHADGKIIVTDYCIQDERVGYEIVIFMWTFNGRLELNFAYNYGYLNRSFVESFAQMLQRKLAENLT